MWEVKKKRANTEQNEPNLRGWLILETKCTMKIAIGLSSSVIYIFIYLINYECYLCYS